MSTFDGMAKIKPEFLVGKKTEVDQQPDLKRIKIDGEDEEPSNEPAEENGQEPAVKDKKEKKKRNRGQNKAKHRPWIPRNDIKLCPQYCQGQPASDNLCQRNNCNMVHDIKEYLDSSLTVLVDKPCYIYETYGKCPRGLQCLFVKSHMELDDNQMSKNKVNEELWASKSSHYEEMHKLILDRDLQSKLRKKGIYKEIDELCNKLPPPFKFVEETVEKRIGAITDEDIIRVRKEEVKNFDWQDKLYLSPLTTVGNLPFRRLCVEFGADITCSEMSMATSLLSGSAHEFALQRRHPSEKIWGVQICASRGDIAAKTAMALQEADINFDFIDLNTGCPLEPICNMGAGAGLLYRQNNFQRIVNAMTATMKKPFTVKMRTGIKTGKNITHNILPFLRDAGVSMVTLHGRSKEQRYSKLANWDYIGECSKICAPMPLYGNGDILSWEEYELKKTVGVSGVVIGRGALTKPWIFQEIKEKRHMDLNSTQRMEILNKYVNYGLDHWGSDYKGVETTRRFLLEFMSFFNRYIPHGILVSPPQRMNERPPAFIGRDSMETLLASSNSADWIKISEMFLGQVPENFDFMPKHKSNAW